MSISIQKIEVANLSKAVNGEPFTFKGHGYIVKGIDRYENDAGKECAAVTVSTACIVCGEPFEITTRRRPKWLPRTCGRHHGQSAAPKVADAPEANVGARATP